MKAPEISKRLRALSDPVIAEHAQRYFKTGKGEYGEGDRFLGIRVPVLRAQVRQCGSVALEDIHELLMSAFHEERLFALLLMVRQFSKGDAQEQAAIYRMYLDNTRRINNWDLVDSSARQIVGSYLESRDRKILYKLARSSSIWERRIAVISTFHFIARHQFDDALKLAKLLLGDEADLIHKAVGWILREIGKCDLAVEKAFLQTHYKNMPRTMLRYAIERFPETLRKKYLAGGVRLNH
ncbi:MAG: DNA alkylation repair protein [Gallionella sp.]|nr:DNA alkylation repair protein [Gallionella sp.]